MRLPPSSINVAASLEEQILACQDIFKLSELLRAQSHTSAPSKKLDAHLREFLRNPVPHLTSQVLTVYRYTGCKETEILEIAAAFLQRELYHDRWYDETITAIGWANEHLKYGETSSLTSAYEAFLLDIELAGDSELLEFCQGYRRD